MKEPVFSVVLSCLLLCWCGVGFGDRMEKEKNHYTTISDVPVDVWKKLASRKIYFGHQSVGFDILQGMQELMAEYPFIKLNISENIDHPEMKSGIFLHSRVGKNVNPVSKINAFNDILSGGLGEKLDIAGFKFCFVDFETSENNHSVLERYVACMKSMQNKFPRLTVIHFTVPLMAIQLSWKDKIKKILGKKIDDNSLGNIARNEYNEILKKHLGKEAPLFDLAKIESTYPDGSRCTFQRGGKTYFSMVPEYTYDGGHLTKLGRKRVAEQFLLFLASIVEK